MTAPPVITNEDGVVDSSCSPLTPGARATCGRGVTIGDSSCAGSSSRAARRRFCCGHGAGSNLPEPERRARLPRIAGVVQCASRTLSSACWSTRQGELYWYYLDRLAWTDELVGGHGCGAHEMPAHLEAGLRRWPRSSASIRGHAEQSRSGLCAAEFSATMTEIGKWLDANRHQLTRYKYDHTDEAFAMRFDGIYCSFPQPASADPRSRRCRPSIRR